MSDQPSTPPTFVLWLKRLRRAQDLTQEALSDALRKGHVSGFYHCAFPRNKPFRYPSSRHRLPRAHLLHFQHMVIVPPGGVKLGVGAFSNFKFEMTSCVHCRIRLVRIPGCELLIAKFGIVGLEVGG